MAVGVVIRQVWRMKNSVLVEMNWLNIVLVIPLMVQLRMVAVVLAIVMDSVEGLAMALFSTHGEVVVVLFTVGHGSGSVIVSVMFINIERLENKFMLSSLVMVILMPRFMTGLLLVNVLLVVYMLHRFFSIDVVDGLLVHILVVWTVINFDPLLFVAWSLLNVTRVFTTIPESVVMHLLLMLDMVFNWVVNVVLIACLEVRLVRRMQVEVSFVTFVLVAIVLLFVILEISVKHTMMFISIFLNVASDLVLWVCCRFDVVLHIVLLLVCNAVLYAQISDLFSA